jgi:hypothetical protein
MKRTLKKIKNFILWTVFYINFISFILAVCCMDSDYYILFGFIMLLNMAYMSLFGIVNYDRFNKWIEKGC